MPEAQQAGLLRPSLVHVRVAVEQDVRGRLECVPALLGLRDVARDAAHGNVDLVAGGEQRARPARHLSGREVGPEVEAEDPVHAEALEDAGLADDLGAARGLLGRLEDHEHAPGQLVQVERQVAGQPERHGHVAVVTAGVHPASVLALEGDPGPLRDGQGVHVGSHGAGPLGAAVEEAAQGGAAGREDPHARVGLERPELIQDVGERLVEVEVQLGDAVQVAAVAGEQLEVGLPDLLAHRRSPPSARSAPTKPARRASPSSRVSRSHAKLRRT